MSADALSTGERVTYADAMLSAVVDDHITFEQFWALIGCGLVDERAELIDGVVIPPRPESPRHRRAAASIAIALFDLRPSPGFITQDTHMVFQGETGHDSAPRPDVMLLSVDSLDVETQLGPEHVDVAIEVSVTSQATDFGIKSRNYRFTGIRHYLVVDMPFGAAPRLVVPAGFETPPDEVMSKVRDALQRVDMPAEP